MHLPTTVHHDFRRGYGEEAALAANRPFPTATTQPILESTLPRRNGNLLRMDVHSHLSETRPPTP
jgi:hypothetical protein